jgi:ATP/maltotriose-dependent transcriptional regulator MalT
MGEASLLGREHEQAQIDRLLEAAREGASGTLVVSGPPGIGKTALLAYASRSATGSTVLSARGVESESELPFSGLSELLRPLSHLLDRISGPLREALSAAIGLARPTPGDPLTTAVATLTVLALAAEPQPLLALVDDAHWLDSASLNNLAFVARRLGAEGIVMLFAAREQPPQLSTARLPELVLEPLQDTAARELARQVRPSMAPHVVDAVLQTAQGNPMAVVELPALLSETEASGQSPPPDPLLLSATLADAFRRQIEDLSDSVREAVLLAAAADSDESGLVMQALSGMSGGRERLEEAERRGMLTLDGEIHFRHPLLRSTLYYDASAEQRRLAHRALADAFPGDDRSLRRAWHLGLSSSDPDEQIAATLAEAALDARLRSGYGAAAQAFERAGRLSPDRAVRSQRLVEAARDFQLVGNLRHASEVLDEALACEPTPVLQAEIRHLQGRGQMLAGSPTEGHAAMVQAAALIEVQAPGQAAIILGEAAYASLGMAEAAIGLATAQHAFELAEAAQDDSLFLATIVLMEALGLLGERQQAEALLDRCLPLLIEGDPLPQVSWLVHGPALSLIYFERHDDARRLLGRVVGAARARSAPGILPLALAALGELEFRVGNWTAGLLNASESVQLAEETGQLNFLAYCLTLLARFDAVQGRVDACKEGALRARELGATGYGPAVDYHANVALARLAVGEVEYQQAALLLEPVEQASVDRGLNEPNMLQWEPDLIEAYVHTSRAKDARRSLARLERLAEKTGGTWANAAAARCRGLLASDEAFEDDFAAARAWHSRLLMPFEAARTELCLGERLRRARRRSEARIPLRSALETFERLGADPWAARARAELRASGATPRSQDPSPLSELTPRELQVALVVTNGATNREAAASLFLSPKTIDYHLQNIFRKLGVRSRTELARRLEVPAASPQEPSATA